MIGSEEACKLYFHTNIVRVNNLRVNACRDYGQRVQYSVFEIEVDSAQWTFLKNRLCELIDPEQDSLRFYYLGRNWQNKVEHVGAKPALDLNGPLIL